MLVLIHKTTSPKVPVSFHPLPPQIFQFPDVYFLPFPAKSTCQSKYTLHCGGWQSSQYWSCLFILFIYTYIYVFFSPLQNECSDDLLMLRAGPLITNVLTASRFLVTHSSCWVKCQSGGNKNISHLDDEACSPFEKAHEAAYYSRTIKEAYNPSTAVKRH